MNRLLRHRLVNRALARVVRPFTRFLSTDVLWNLPVVGTVEVRPDGWSAPPVLMANDGNDRVASMLFWRGVEGWEPATVRVFLALVSTGSTVLDIGANSGLFSLLAARRDPTVRVHAVEPVGRVFSLLEANVALNDVGNVRCHHLACGDSSGPARLHVPAGEGVPMMASLLTDWCDASETEEVHCVTIDELVAGAGADRVDVVKIDAEGSEAAVLDGAGATLEAHRPFVLCEVLNRSGLGARIEATLAARDYRFFSLGPDGPRPCSEVTGGIDDDESHNYLFVHASRVGEVAPLAASS